MGVGVRKKSVMCSEDRLIIELIVVEDALDLRSGEDLDVLLRGEGGGVGGEDVTTHETGCPRA